MKSHLRAPDEDSNTWWNAIAEHRLTYQQCDACGAVVFYPRHRCNHCLSDALVWRLSSGLGTIYSRTLVHRAPDPKLRDQVPYVVVLVNLDEGFRMMSQLLGPDAAQAMIGARVKVVFEPGPDGTTLPFFKPLDSIAGNEGEHRGTEGENETA